MERESRIMWCPECEDYIYTNWTDEGIGPYEYWGARGNQVLWCESCPECDAGIEHLKENKPTCEGCEAEDVPLEDDFCMECNEKACHAVY